MIGLIILGVLLLLFLFILFLPSKLVVDYRLQEKEQTLSLRVSVLGIPITFDVPLEQKRDTKKKSKAKEKKKRKTPKEFIDFSKKVYGAYQDIKADSKEILHEIRGRITCTDFGFSITYGTGNPATTGILNGAVWTAATLLLKVADATFSLSKKRLTVEPVFTRACLTIHSKVTLRYTLIHILYLLRKIKKLVKKFQDKIKTDN